MLYKQAREERQENGPKRIYSYYWNSMIMVIRTKKMSQFYIP